MRNCVLIPLVVIWALLPVAARSQLPPPYCTQWGSGGSDPGQFEHPYGVAVDAAGQVYVADTGNSRLQVFTSSGGYITQWGSYGTGSGQFMLPLGVAVDASGNIYVADMVNDCIQKFTSSGGYITQWGSEGAGPGQFFCPWSVAVDAAGHVYVADTGNCRIQVFGYAPTAVQNTTWGRIKSMFR